MIVELGLVIGEITSTWVAHKGIALDISLISSVTVTGRFINFIAKTDDYRACFEYDTEHEANKAFEVLTNHINALRI